MYYNDAKEKKCLSHSKLVMNRCILWYQFIGKCSINLNFINFIHEYFTTYFSIFLNRLKEDLLYFVLLFCCVTYFAISCGFDFISKANEVSVSPCSVSAIYPKLLCKKYPSHCIFLVIDVNLLFKLILVRTQFFPRDKIPRRQYIMCFAKEDYLRKTILTFHYQYHWLTFLFWFP